MWLLLIKLFMHSYLTEMKIQSFIIQLNYINFTDIPEHVENINLVGLNLESFSQKTIAEPLSDNIPEEIKLLVLRKRNEILGKARGYINNFLNPSKIDFYDATRDDFIEVKSVFWKNSVLLNESLKMH